MVRLRAETARCLAGLAAALGLAACGPAPRPADAPPLTHSVSVWAPTWNAETSLALDADRLDARLSALRIFVGAAGRVDDAQRFPVDWSAVARSGRSVEPAILLQRGAWSATAADLAAASDLLAEALASARAAEVRVTGVHLETDCPPGRLRALAAALPALRARLGVPVGVALLPAHLGRDGHAELAAAADSLTLNLMRGRALGGDPALPDASVLDDWLVAAAAPGRPFRVGLSLSSHYRCDDDSGNALGEVLVGLRPPAATARVRHLGSDPDAVGVVMRRLAGHGPALLVGVDWFRLPVPGDQGTWSADGLRAALDDRPLPRALESLLQADEDGSLRVVLANVGMIPLDPAEVEVSWTEGKVQVCDGAGGYELLAPGPQGFRLRPRPGCPVVGPGETRVIGWVRFEAAPAASAARLIPR